MNIQVGQNVYIARQFTRNAELSEAQVTKVGRKWAQIGTWARFDMTTGELDGRFHYGCVFESREAFEQEVARRELERSLTEDWQKVCDSMSLWRRPAHLGETEMKALKDLLRIS